MLIRKQKVENNYDAFQTNKTCLYGSYSVIIISFYEIPGVSYLFLYNLGGQVSLLNKFNKLINSLIIMSWNGEII